MTKPSDLLSLLGGIAALVTLPFGLLAGFVTGLLAPVAAIALMVSALRLLTGKVPYLHRVSEDEDGGRNLTFRLTTPDEARELFSEQKVELGGDLEKMKNEIQAIIQEARQEGQLPS
jgi:hypothetical protein